MTLLKKAGIETRAPGRVPPVVSAILLIGGLALGLGAYLSGLPAHVTFQDLLVPSQIGQILAVIGGSLLPWANGFIGRAR